MRLVKENIEEVLGLDTSKFQIACLLPFGYRLNEQSSADKESLDAAFQLSKLEGIIPALESAHALAVLEYLPLGENDITVINLSGRGDKDLDTYMKYL